jgi:predicted enzyme related to lactoylglutathione lyase
VSPPAQPDVEIVLETPDMGRPPAARTSLEQLMAQGALSAVLFRADDVDATFEKIRASGAEVLQEPIDQPYGVRDCAFRDPSGNQIRISSSLT